MTSPADTEEKAPDEVEQQESESNGVVDSSIEERIAKLESAYEELLKEKAERAKYGFRLPTSQESRSLPQVSSMKPTRVPEEAPSAPVKERWLPFEIIAEVRCIARMYLDFRYSITFTTKVAVPAIILLIVLNWWLVKSFPFVGWILGPALHIILIYVLSKVLSREATRYRKTSLDLPRSLRL